MPTIEFRNVTLNRHGKTLLDDFNLKIDDGEYFALVGETGAGKTTILNLINGLLLPDRGEVLIGGKNVQKVPCELRDTGMVFEDYSLFPHYTVFKNVVYSHRVRDKEPEATKKIAREILNLMLLFNRDKALPSELSGGMQQRVALARALMTNSGILLMDDPFSALDAGLRMSLRIELKHIASDVGTTVIHCTNDVEEAMMVSNRMALIKAGKIVQLGSPNDIYYNPASLYVAAFLSDVNLLSCEVTQVDREHGYYILNYIRTDKENDFRVPLRDDILKENDRVTLCIRAEHVQLHKGFRKKPNRLYGKIDEISFLGNIIRYEIIDERGIIYKAQRFVNEKTKHLQFNKGEEVTIHFQPALGLLFPPIAGGGENL